MFEHTVLVVYGEHRIAYISNKLALPDWWIKSVIVEYLACRRFGENGRLWTLDFSKLTSDDINKIPELNVVIPNYLLVQNIKPEDLSVRFALSSIGLPFTPLEDANLFPEGLANKTMFPWLGNPMDVHDHKQSFGFRAIVRDNGCFYQWTISETLNLEGKHYHWYKSEYMDLSKLLQINEEIMALSNSPDLKEPDTNFIAKIEKAYQKLEAARVPLRKKILEYHNSKKDKFNPAHANVQKLPMLSVLDGIKLTKNGYQVKTHMEPLFLRSAIRNSLKAQTALHERKIKPNSHYALLDEIEYSATCIISAVNCLESYINYIINKYLPDESKDFMRKSHLKKWECIPSALDPSFKFKTTEQPFSDFSKLVRWRNNIVHYKLDYANISEHVCFARNYLNAESAKLAIKVVRNMVTKLSEGGRIPVPTWIKTDMGSAPGYWDEVSNYLKNIENL